MMRRTLLFMMLVIPVGHMLSGQQGPASEPVTAARSRICVGTLNTEIRQASDTVALRDRLAEYLRRGMLSKQANADIQVLKGDSDESTAPELKELKCDYAVYTRALAAQLKEQKRPDTDRVTIIRPVPETLALVPGLQFTVVRVSTGIPVYIDRVFLDRPYGKAEDMWFLLRREQELIEVQLMKKIAPAANPG